MVGLGAPQWAPPEGRGLLPETAFHVITCLGIDVRDVDHVLIVSSVNQCNLSGGALVGCCLSSALVIGCSRQLFHLLSELGSGKSPIGQKPGTRTDEETRRRHCLSRDGAGQVPFSCHPEREAWDERAARQKGPRLNLLFTARGCAGRAWLTASNAQLPVGGRMSAYHG